MRSAFKCMKSVLPRATNAIFSEVNEKGDIKYDKKERDPPRPDNEHGYITTGSGDSGSPYWSKSDSGVATLIAINHGGIPNRNENSAWYGNDDFWQCRTIATKITEAMQIWMTEKEQNEPSSKRK